MTRDNDPWTAPIDSYSWHEALDRCHLLAGSFDSDVLRHEVVEDDAELTTLAERAWDAMMDLYQAIGRKAPHMAAKFRERVDPEGRVGVAGIEAAGAWRCTCGSTDGYHSFVCLWPPKPDEKQE